MSDVKKSWIIGIDEVGRGPLAGPVGVGVACVPANFNWQQLPGVTDSKQLTEIKRAEIMSSARILQAAGTFHYEVAMVSAKVIDRIGIVPAIMLAMNRALTRVETRMSENTSLVLSNMLDAVEVKLDGGLKAPEWYLQQETIIKGDAKEPAIGLASIVAKVRRDSYMRRLATLAAYHPYGFDAHKGYGTKAHRAAIAQYGLSDQHRVSYCKNIKVL